MRAQLFVLVIAVTILAIDAAGARPELRATVAQAGVARARATDRPDPTPSIPRSAKKDPDLASAPTHTARFGLTLRNLHTGELLPLTRLDETATPTGPAGASLGAPSLSRPSATAWANFLRCRVTGEVHPMPATLLDQAVAAAAHFGATRIEVVSGFRSEKLNELLRKKGHEVAQRSHHMAGEALDFRIVGVTAVALSSWLAATYQGGLGTYGHSDFVHIDVGRNRRWRGR